MFIWNNEPPNQFVTNVVNALKQEASHLLPKLSRDGGKIGIPEEVDEELKLSRLKNGILKLKVHQAEKTKSFIKKEALFYKWCFIVCEGLILYVVAII